jgi:hypothetical protein
LNPVNFFSREVVVPDKIALTALWESDDEGDADTDAVTCVVDNELLSTSKESQLLLLLLLLDVDVCSVVVPDDDPKHPWLSVSVQ